MIPTAFGLAIVHCGLIGHAVGHNRQSGLHTRCERKLAGDLPRRHRPTRRRSRADAKPKSRDWADMLRESLAGYEQLGTGR